LARQVLYEDKHLLVLNKWAGQLSQGSAKADSKSNNLLADAASYLGDSKKFVGLVHRLDRPVSGVFILAKTSAAAKALSEDLRERKIQKHYIALVNGIIPARTENKKLGSLVTKDPLNNKTHVIPTADLHANEVKRIKGLPHVRVMFY
jgi:23S rRNA pseudouridine1911/1915/1917 synthase